MDFASSFCRRHQSQKCRLVEIAKRREQKRAAHNAQMSPSHKDCRCSRPDNLHRVFCSERTLPDQRTNTVFGKSKYEQTTAHSRQIATRNLPLVSHCIMFMSIDLRASWKISYELRVRCTTTAPHTNINSGTHPCVKQYGKGDGI